MGRASSCRAGGAAFRSPKDAQPWLAGDPGASRLGPGWWIGEVVSISPD